MVEKEIERRMCDMIRKRGGLTYKFITLESGVPDRIVILPSGVVWFVELKSQKGRLSKIQRHQLARLEKQKANVRVVYGIDEVLKFVEEIFSETP